jgi:carbon monoxide dehydrogenase subunit G
MDDLTARLEALLRLYAAAGDRGEGSARLTGQFQEDLQLLVAKYGPRVVDATLEKLGDEVWPSVSLH